MVNVIIVAYFTDSQPQSIHQTVLLTSNENIKDSRVICESQTCVSECVCQFGWIIGKNVTNNQLGKLQNNFNQKDLEENYQGDSISTIELNFSFEKKMP